MDELNNLIEDLKDQLERVPVTGDIGETRIENRFWGGVLSAIIGVSMYLVGALYYDDYLFVSGGLVILIASVFVWSRYVHLQTKKDLMNSLQLIKEILEEEQKERHVSDAEEV